MVACCTADSRADVPGRAFLLAVSAARPSKGSGRLGPSADDGRCDVVEPKSPSSPSSPKSPKCPKGPWIGYPSVQAGVQPVSGLAKTALGEMADVGLCSGVGGSAAFASPKLALGENSRSAVSGQPSAVRRPPFAVRRSP